MRDRVRDIRPARSAGFEARFETPPGEQAQVDFARFEVEFADEPGAKRIVWLFSMVLGYSLLIWARFVLHQDLQSVLRCHIAALEANGGAPRTILYDRMKTAVIGEDADRLVVYNRALLDLARHYGFQPRACRPYRAKTKGKVERPFRYIREDFFLGGVFRNLDDLNEQLRHWLDTVANPRVHATTNRVVNEAVAEGGNRGRPRLRADPLGLSNWQMTQKTVFEMRNKTGSDVHIAASTMAGRAENREYSAPLPCRSPPKSRLPHLSGVRSGGTLLRLAEGLDGRDAFGPKPALAGVILPGRRQKAFLAVGSAQRGPG